MQTQNSSADNKYKNKPISIGDYEIIGKNESKDNFYYNYGFFSNVLEDENKQVKILYNYLYQQIN